MQKTALALTAAVVLGAVGLVSNTGAKEKEAPRKRVEKKKRAKLSPVQKALKNLPPVQAAPLERKKNTAALQQHIQRVKNAPDTGAEAREIEALVGWLQKHQLAKYFKIRLGVRCTDLTDEDLLALSSWPSATLVLEGYVDECYMAWSEIAFKDPKNLKRLIPLAVPTRGGNRQKR